MFIEKNRSFTTDVVTNVIKKNLMIGDIYPACVFSIPSLMLKDRKHTTYLSNNRKNII